MSLSIHRLLDEIFSVHHPVNGAKTFYYLGHLLSQIFPDGLTVAQVGTSLNSTHLDNLRLGFEHGANSEKKVKLIGIDPKLRPPPYIEYRRGTAQELPLNPGEVDVLVHYDTLSFANIYDGDIEEMCNQDLRVSPWGIIIGDPEIYFRMQMLGNGRKIDSYQEICTRLSEFYTEVGLQKYLGKSSKSNRWLFFVRNDYS